MNYTASDLFKFHEFMKAFIKSENVYWSSFTNRSYLEDEIVELFNTHYKNGSGN